MSESFLERWDRESDERHAREVAGGEHDEQCEYGPRLLTNRTHADDYRVIVRMCNCRKRRRIASGFTEPPGALEHRMPDCSHCGKEVDHDGESFVCYDCHVFWNPQDHEDPGTFTDDCGYLGQPVPEEQS